MTSGIHLSAARCEALFASALQPSDRPTAAQVRAEIMHTVRQLGSRGCAARMAQEFGDAPQPAVARMRWARQVVADVFTSQPACTRPQPGGAHALAA